MDKKTVLYRVLAIAFGVVACAAIIIVGSKGVKVNVKLDFNNSVSSDNVAVDTTAAVEQTEAPTQLQVTTEAPASAQAADTNVPASTQPAASTSTETTQSAAEQTTAAQEKPAQTGDKSVAEIVELYNKSVNKVKKEAKQITRNYKHLSIPEDTLELPSAIQGLGKTAISTFVKPDDTKQVWTTSDDFNLVFPVGTTDYSSKMTADMVKTATCKDNGNEYEVEIILLDDAITSPVKGEGYAGIFNTTTASTFEGINIPTVTFNEVKINGVNGSIKCTIDKASERVASITFANTDIMYLNVKVAFASLEAKMNMVSEENFDIVY